MQVLHVGREVPVTVALAALLERSFPTEYAARRAEQAALVAGSGDEAPRGPPLPLFVMNVLLPGNFSSSLFSADASLTGPMIWKQAARP